MIHGVVGEGALILKQFATVDEPLLVGGHSQAALLDQVLQLRDRRIRLDGELKSNTCARDLPRGILRILRTGRRGGGAASRGALPSMFLTVTSIPSTRPSASTGRPSLSAIHTHFSHQDRDPLTNVLNQDTGDKTDEKMRPFGNCL
jgi:hypothetical protein